MQLSSRILTALAVLILAVAVVAVRAGSPGTVEAATGTINVLNVGTCYTTDTDVFGVGDCDDGDGNDPDDPDKAGYDVAFRDSITKVDSVYATYAIDPKTSGDQPRVIVTKSDLIKINIEDKGRDKRSGVLYAVGTGTAEPTADQQAEIIGALMDRPVDELLIGDTDDSPATVNLTSPSNEAVFVTATPSITSSGLYQFRLTGTASTTHPMAPEGDGDVFWFGTGPVPNPVDPSQLIPGFTDLTDEFIELDEDLNSGTFGEVAPWMRVSAQIPDTTIPVTVQYIYYETSEEEVLVGGAKSAVLVDGVKSDTYPTDAEPPRFYERELVTELNPNVAALVVNASADGKSPSQHLRLKEDGRFSGNYVGYLRLTDADGDGRCETDVEDVYERCNWGLEAKDAADGTASGAAVISVESGPIKINYRDSTGDPETKTIWIDKEPPTIQVDSPLHNTSSKDDSPELLGSFTDGGGSGLRDDSFKVYADNVSDKLDINPIWPLRVDNNMKESASEPGAARGHLCVDSDEESAGCETDGVAALRGHYAGYTREQPTFGIIPSEEVYFLDDQDPDKAGEEYKSGGAESYEDGDTSGIFDTVVRIDFEPDKVDKGRYNHIIDIQAAVMDIAGNIGFSDSEPSDPTFIHDVGTTNDNKERDALDTHNVIGWYSRHIYFLDDVDPKFSEKESATGFYVDADGDVLKTDSGLMVVFDGKIDASTVGVGTFAVELDNGSDASVTDVSVDGNKVYLRIEEQLAPDATPSVELASGQSISDLAGNESTDRRLEGIELSDGILPTFTITLSGGSGLNDDVDGEGPSGLTNKSGIKVSISSNESIQGSPKFSVVCHGLTWGPADKENDAVTFASERTGPKETLSNAQPNEEHRGVEPTSGEDERTSCPNPKKGMEGEEDRKHVEVAETSALARAGNNWEYQWASLSGLEAVDDGKLSVIVWGRDRSSYFQVVGSTAKRLYNYSAATSSFVYDTDLEAAWEGNDDYDDAYGELIPAEGEDVFELRPFVLLDFGDEGTTVDVTAFQVDGVDYTADLQALEDQEFVWWPERLDYGTYEVYVEANDAANNTGEHTYSFTVKARAAFVLDLLAGWNSISFPANPIDRALHAVFTNTAIDQVIGWNVTEPVSPWRMATRVDGVWTTNEEFATLNDVEARYGYWVHSTGFITQAVDLAGKGDRATDGQPNPSDIPTDQGWNFIGVVDVDGDQTQDDAGETLRNSNNDPITAAEYLGNYTRAYTWDHINNTWDVVKNSEGITIGTGVWVYYTSDHDIAP